MGESFNVNWLWALTRLKEPGGGHHTDAQLVDHSTNCTLDSSGCSLMDSILGIISRRTSQAQVGQANKL